LPFTLLLMVLIDACCMLQELRALGCAPCLEFPAQQVTPATLPLVTQQLEQAAVEGPASATATRGVQQQQQQQQQQPASGVWLRIDAACLMPVPMLAQVQQLGLARVLQQARAQAAGDGSRPASTSSAGTDAQACVAGTPVAVEVDGPSHVAANDRQHALGATLCRDWLLQQLGWPVVKVAWWEWQ
jgi:hypothetical protein